MKPMLLTSAVETPMLKGWIYEVKYDGFRCILDWEKNSTPKLLSRNGKMLNDQFPEIIGFCDTIADRITQLLPLTLDGEIVHLVNDYQSDFNIVQRRGRMRKKTMIQIQSEQFPCQLVVFDLLRQKGKVVTNTPLSKRKDGLKDLFHQLELQIPINYLNLQNLQLIHSNLSSTEVWDSVKKYNGEGIIAKKATSTWNPGQRTTEWIKVKNWRVVTVLLTKYDQENGYFHGAIYRGETLLEIVIFQHGLTEEEKGTLISLFKENGNKTGRNIWGLPPSICIDIACIDFDGKHLREPRFHAFAFNGDPDLCTWKVMQRQLFPFPEKIDITHPDKPLWPKSRVDKDDYLLYLQKIAPHLMPFLKDRLLTVIRFPHGLLSEERFYQKNRPDYAPNFVKSVKIDDIDYILCNDIETLMWLGNQLALEFHIPFQTIHTQNPTEIVFDLDPPSTKEFSLAVEAAVRMKAIFDQFQLSSFVKTSGGKGLQVYIPLPENKFSYAETRVFTQFICTFLCEQLPDWFTVERLKKNRANRLYLDFIQHDKGKTIIAPYSPRGNENGLIATPLLWEEVNDTLSPQLFTLDVVLERSKSIGNPFRSFRQSASLETFAAVLEQLNELIPQ
ncbi:DNA ligase D [Bacillus solitudinis]|uniref:DNA ligase D n=1 Tax=Bacillus solitudinis TaxID=2014074 RepID=UPI000C243659|nr:DNA ligase D [Bacillus solitudinis]